MKKTLILFTLFSVTFIQCKDDKEEETPAVEICNDGIDNDNDGFIDCADFDCNSKCPETNCSDGIDNDSDGFTDCEDNDCKGKSGC